VGTDRERYNGAINFVRLRTMMLARCLDQRSLAALSVFIGRRLHAGVVAEDALPADRYQRFLAGRVTGLDMTWLSTGRPVRLISIRADGGA
jgi:hypothetical protein